MAKRIIFPLLVLVSIFFMSANSAVLNENIRSGFATASLWFQAPEPEPAPALPHTIAAPVRAEMDADPRERNLRTLVDSELRAKLDVRLKANPVWRKLIAQKRMSVGIVDLDGKPRYAAVNPRHMMYAASLPKIAVLAAAHDAIERGELRETAEVKRDMRLMIAKSNNAATTRMIDRVGFENIERTMTDPDLKLYDPEYGGGLWVGKRYAAGGRRHPDPMKGISHAASVEQICRFFYLLHNDNLVSEESSQKMREYLVDPELHHKFVSVLDRRAPEAKVYRKSGSWSTYHADVAMVQGPERNYIITALVDDARGEQIIRELGRVLDNLLLEEAK